MRRDRDRHGGGLVVYAVEHLTCNRLSDIEMGTVGKGIEAIWFELIQPKTKKILLGAIYRPPSSHFSTFLAILEDMLCDVTERETETILLGDFNLDYSTPATELKNFKRLINLFHLKQIIVQPIRITNRTSSLIDLFLTSKPELYLSGVIPVGFSDHCAIYRIRKLHRVKTSQPRVVVVRNYKNFDANLFKSDLSHVPWDILSWIKHRTRRGFLLKTCF